MSESPAWMPEDYTALGDLVASLVKRRQFFAQAEDGPQDRDSLSDLEDALKSRGLDTYLDHLRALVPLSFHQGLSLPAIMRQLSRVSDLAFRALSEDYGTDLPRLIRAGQALVKLKDAISEVIGESYANLTAALVEDENKKIIRELSTPVIQVWEGILVAPIVGVLDSSRAHQLSERLLSRISELDSRIVILDVTGVGSVDSEVANHLIRVTKAARLLGACTLMVGIAPRVAQTLVRLDIDLSTIETYIDFRSGLERAFNLLGCRIEALS